MVNYKSSPITIEKYIKGINFPASKEDLIHKAEENGAPEDVISMLNQFDEHEYNSPIDIPKEAGRLH